VINFIINKLQLLITFIKVIYIKFNHYCIRLSNSLSISITIPLFYCLQLVLVLLLLY